MATATESPRLKKNLSDIAPRSVPPHRIPDVNGAPVGFINVGKVLMANIAPFSRKRKSGLVIAGEAQKDLVTSYFGVCLASGLFACHPTAVPRQGDPEYDFITKLFPLPPGTLITHNDGNFRESPDYTTCTIDSWKITQMHLPGQWPDEFVERIHESMKEVEEWLALETTKRAIADWFEKHPDLK